VAVACTVHTCVAYCAAATPTDILLTTDYCINYTIYKIGSGARRSVAPLIEPFVCGCGSPSISLRAFSINNTFLCI
jgi:hypothetical protein